MHWTVFRFLLVMIAVCGAVAFAIANQSLKKQQQNRNAYQRSQEIKEKLKEQYPIVDFSAPEPSDPKERANRVKRSKKYNGHDKVVDPDIVERFDGYNWPSDFKPIPVSASDVIIIGTISDAEAYLSEDKNSVYSEFTVTISEVIKNNTSLMLRPDNSVTMERQGGRVRYASGHVSWFSVVGQGLPQLNEKYVLFLKTTEEERLFDILTGYQIVKSRIEPLDNSPGVVHFERYSGSDVTDFVNQIRSDVTMKQP